MKRHRVVRFIEGSSPQRGVRCEECICSVIAVAYCLKIPSSGRGPGRSALESVLHERLRNTGIPIHDQESRVPKERLLGIGEIARHLHHPRLVRMWGDTGDLHCPARQVEKEEDVVRD